MQRPKFSVDEQIEHMKSKGIKFNIVNEAEASKYLCDNTYYFKIKSYAKMFERYRLGDKKGQYVDLEFAYLKELAIVDMHLRHFILKASVDVEHAIKVQFMEDFNNSKSDGYDIVAEYFRVYPDIEEKILRKKDNSYCEDLINKLKVEGYAVWNLIEIISFGDFINLYRLFYEKFPDAKQGKVFTYPMYSIKSLRNAAAHNNCILNQLMKAKDDEVKINKKVTSFVSKIDGIGKEQRVNCMKKQVVHDFVTLLYVIDNAVKSPGVKKNILTDLSRFMNEQAVRKKEYFRKNNELKAVYAFSKKVVDNMMVIE